MPASKRHTFRKPEFDDMLTVRISKKAAKRLSRAARRQKRSRSDLAREILSDAVETLENPAKP